MPGIERKKAKKPEQLAELFVARANEGDLEGLLALYEANAVVAFPGESTTSGHEALRQVYGDFLATKPQLTLGRQHEPLRLGDYALTSTLLDGGGGTAEVAHRQPDGTWLWILDRPNVVP